MPRTLVIDDDPTFRSALVRQLEARGHRTTAVSSIEQALEKKDQAWDLVLCDLYLRDGDGRQMLEALSKTHPEVPVVVLSGSRSMEDVIEVFRAQARDFLRKPLRPAELDAMLERVPVSYMKSSWELIRAEPEPIPELIASLDCSLLFARHGGCLLFNDEGFEDIAAMFPDARTTVTEKAPSADPGFAAAVRSLAEEIAAGSRS